MRVALIKLEPHELTTDDIAYLLPSVKQSGESWEAVAHELVAGSAVAWRIEGRKSTGMLITQVQNGDTLYLWHFGGEGLWMVSKSIVAAIQEIVRRNGLKAIRSESTPTIAKFLQRLNFATPRSVMEWRA